MSIFSYPMWNLLVSIVPKSHIQLVQNITEAPQIKGKWDFSLCIIFVFSFISSKIQEKATWVAEVEPLGVSWCSVCGVGFVQGRQGPFSWFLYYPRHACESRRSVVPVVARPELLFAHQAGTWPCARAIPDLFFSPLSTLSVVQNQSTRRQQAYLGSRGCFLPSWMNPFQCTSCFRRTIIETPPSSQLWSTAGLHFTQTRASGSLPRTRSRHNHGCSSRLPGWQRTGQTRASDAPAFRDITVELRAPNERRNESARPVIVTSFANKPGPSPASKLFRNLPHFS